MADAVELSPLTLNRLSLYLRCLGDLEERGVSRVSSHELARRYHLSAAQIRKDLAQLGEFGIRGVGYDVRHLAARLNTLLGLDRRHPLLIVGMGNLGSALARYPGFNQGCFEVVAGIDNDPQKVGRKIGAITVRSTRDLRRLARETGAEIACLAVPAEAAPENFLALCEAGIKAVLNFAPVRLEPRRGVRVKNVDLRTGLEELAYFLRE
jgi:redox-sensing transcriptional repressor